jgi:hypothetical protein
VAASLAAPLIAPPLLVTTYRSLFEFLLSGPGSGAAGSEVTKPGLLVVLGELSESRCSIDPENVQENCTFSIVWCELGHRLWFM